MSLFNLKQYLIVDLRLAVIDRRRVVHAGVGWSHIRVGRHPSA
jgi:hypothetical protein